MKEDQNVEKKNTRENFFWGKRAIINHQIQINYMLTNILLLSGLFIGIGFLISYKLDRISYQTMTSDILKLEFLIPIAAIFILFATLSIILNLHQSFKAAAPIYRLNRYFKDVANSQEVLPLSFRKNDYYQDLPPLVIEAFMRVKQKDLLAAMDKDKDKHKKSSSAS